MTDAQVLAIMLAILVSPVNGTSGQDAINQARHFLIEAKKLAELMKEHGEL